MGDPVPNPSGRPDDAGSDDGDAGPAALAAAFGRRMVAWAGLSGLRPGGSVLDIGAGAGAVSIAAAEVLDPTCHIVAGDVSREMVGRLGTLGIARLRPRVLDVTKLDLPESSCDVVLAGFLVHLLPDPGAALAEIARVLRRTGAAVFSVPDPGSGWCAPDEVTATPAPWEALSDGAGLRHRRATAIAIRFPLGGRHAVARARFVEFTVR